MKELRVEVQKEIVEGEILRAEEERLLDLAALQLCGTHILNKRQRSVNTRYKVQLVKGSCVKCRGEYTGRVLKCCTYEVLKCCSVVKCSVVVLKCCIVVVLKYFSVALL